MMAVGSSVDGEAPEGREPRAAFDGGEDAAALGTDGAAPGRCAAGVAGPPGRGGWAAEPPGCSVPGPAVAEAALPAGSVLAGAG